MTITLDPLGKCGSVTERVSVISDATTNPILHIEVTADVVHNANDRGDQLQRIIFSDRCSSCHGAPSAREQTGAALYASVCAMCHERPRGLLSGGEEARRAIADGDLARGMPAYAIRHDGPLTDSQIWSLVEMIDDAR